MNKISPSILVSRSVENHFRLKFKLDGLPKITNSIRVNWKAVHFGRVKWKQEVFKAIYDKLPEKPLEKSKITLTRHSSVCPDYDGLISGFKPIIDGLVQHGVIVDDSMKHIKTEYLWKHIRPKCGYVEIEIEEVLEI
jgi:hypothetical protein